MTEAEAFRRLEETCSLGHGNTVRKRRDCMTCQVLLLVEVAAEEREACARVPDELIASMPEGTIFPVSKGLLGRVRDRIRARTP